MKMEAAWEVFTGGSKGVVPNFVEGDAIDKWFTISLKALEGWVKGNKVNTNDELYNLVVDLK